MRAVQALILFSAYVICPHALAQGMGADAFAHYHMERAKLATLIFDGPEYWTKYYTAQNLAYSALKTDIAEIFDLYLDGTLPSALEIKKRRAEDPVLDSNFDAAASDVIFSETVRHLQSALVDVPLIEKLSESQKTKALIPIHFRVYDDEPETNLSAYFERGTHRVKMALDGVPRENWYTWFIHEHLHFFDPILQTAAQNVGEKERTEQIAEWIRSGHTELSAFEAQQLNQYFTDLTNISILAEWRAWIATTQIAQKMLASGFVSAVPPCLSFLKFAPGQVMPVSVLRMIWWQKLKSGFYVEASGLFKDPWLKAQLLKYVDRINPATESLGGLDELTE